MSSSELVEEWKTTRATVDYLAYKFEVSPQTVKNLVVGLDCGVRMKQPLSEFHRLIGLKIVTLRLRQNINRTAFAKRINTSTRKLSDIEKGFVDVTIGQLTRIARNLGTELSELLDKKVLDCQ